MTLGTRAAFAVALFASLNVVQGLGAPDDTRGPFQLPLPTGPYAVGTTTWRVTDDSREETFAGPGVRRQVEVLAWYPAATRRGEPAPYLREGLLEVQGLASRLGGPRTAYDRLAAVRTHARVDVMPAPTPESFPLLLFSHGYGSVPSAHTALLEDLASHGYAVLSIVHPYEATAATLADGRVVSFLDDTGAPRQGFRDVVSEWDREDETMAVVTRATDEEEQRRVLRGYLSGLHHTDIALRRWVDDTTLVLDRLTTLAPRSVAGRLARRLDVRRVGVFGHSMGGVTAGQFCLGDRRCRAGLNLDGIPQYGSMIDQQFGGPFLMVYSARPVRTGASDAIYRRSASPYFRVDVQQTLHLDFSDMIFWGGPLRDRDALGTLAPTRAAEITRTIIRQYFDQVLLGKRSPLLAGTLSFSEVRVRDTSTPLH